MKVALVIPPIDDKFAMYGKEFDWGWWQPLGLLTIGSYVKKVIDNIEILILDEQITDDIKIMKQELETYKPDFLGVSLSPFTFINGLELARQCKKLGAKIVLGGHYATALGKLLFKDPVVDYVIIEDGESALAGLVNGEPLDKIPNLIWRTKNNHIKQNKIEWPQLDNLPLVDYSLVDLELYFKNYQKQQNQVDPSQPYKRPITICAKKGCRWREATKGGCIYCSCIYPTIRQSSPGKVWNNISMYQSIYNIDSLLFTEDDFLMDEKWIVDFLNQRPDKLKHIGLRFVFARPDSINQKTASILADLNCYQVYLGVESGSNECLKVMRKGVTVERIYKAVQYLYEYNISFIASFVLGAPGESKFTLEKSKRFAKQLVELGARHFTAYPFVPVPGSSAWDTIMKDNKDFRSKFSDPLNLNPVIMADLWINAYCKISFGEIADACDEINFLAPSLRKATEGWI